MSERTFVERLGEELEAAAARRAARRRRMPWPRRRGGRALVLVGAALLLGAGGTAGLLAARGEVGGPPSLTFARLTPEQLAVGVRPLSRPVVFARGRLAFDGRLWQLIGFQTTRGLCIEIDFPQQHRAGGCGSPAPRGGRPIDVQAQIAVARLARAVVLGAVDPAAATVRVRVGQQAPYPGPERRRHGTAEVADARVVRVTEPRLLAALGMRRPFAYYLAELDGGYQSLRAAARTASGRLLGQVTSPQLAGDTSGAFGFRRRGCRPQGPSQQGRPRFVSTMPPPAVRSRIAALRRPQRPDDLPPRWFMRLLRQQPLYATVQGDAIRLLRRGADGVGYYLLPTTQRPFDVRPPAACLRTLTERQRAREEMLARRVQQGARRLSVAVIAIDRRGAASAGSFHLDAYREGRAMYGTNGRRAVGMAPDGVASVELRHADGTRRVVPVVGNVWIAELPRGRGLVGARARSVLWRDADGRVLRRLR